MSYNNSSSVDRDLLREQQRQARAQLVDSTKDVPQVPVGLFPEPIKVASVSDDPLGKRIKKTLGEYDAMKETISNNPKNLIGITRQPHTPHVHHDAPPLFPDLRKPPKPPYLNGQHKPGDSGGHHSRSSSSRAAAARDAGDLGRSQHSSKSGPAPEFTKPNAVAPLSTASSSSHVTSAAGLPGPVSGAQESTKSETSSSWSLPPPLPPLPVVAAPAALLPTPSSSSAPLTSSRQPSSSPTPVVVVKDKSRDRSTGGAGTGASAALLVAPTPPAAAAPPPPPPPPAPHHLPSSGTLSSSKYQSSSSGTAAPCPAEGRANGTIFNGVAKSGGGRSRPPGPKTSLRLQIDNQVVKSHQDDLDTILKEMIAPTPLTGIPTPRKEETSRFPFLSASAATGQMEGRAPSLSTSTKTAAMVVRTLDFDSQRSPVEKQLVGSAPNSSDGVLDADLQLSGESEDEISPEFRTTSGSARSPGQAVLTNPPPALAAMSPTSESSSSDSEDSSSESDTDGNSNKSHSNSEASDVESRPESPKQEMKWCLDAFFHPSSVPFGRPSDPSAVADQESQSLDAGLFYDVTCGGDKGRRLVGTRVGDADDDCPVSDLLKEDMLLLSPAPQPLDSIVDPLDREPLAPKSATDGSLQQQQQPARPKSPPSPSSSKSVVPSKPTKKTTSSSSHPRKRSPASREKVGGGISKEKSRAIRKALGKNGLSRSTPRLIHDDDGQDGAVKVDVQEDRRKDKEVGSSSSTGSKVAPKSSSGESGAAVTVAPGHKKCKSSSKSGNKIGSGGGESDLAAVATGKKVVSVTSEGGADTWRKSHKDSESDSRRSSSPLPPSNPLSKEPVAAGSGGGSSLPSPALSKMLARQDSSGSLKNVVAGRTSTKSSHGKLAGASAAASSSGKTSDKKSSSSSGCATPKTSSVKRGVPDVTATAATTGKRSRSQQSRRIKSREYISDCGASDSSEDEIDVVGTPSPVKLATGAATRQGPMSSSALATSIAATIAAVSAGAGTVKSLGSPQQHRHQHHATSPRQPRSSSSKHHRHRPSSKEKEPSAVPSRQSTPGHGPAAAVPTPVVADKDKLLPDPLPLAKSSAATTQQASSCLGTDEAPFPKLPPLTYKKNGKPSLMVSLMLTFLDRIPPGDSKELRKGVAPCVAPSSSKVRLPKEEGSSAPTAVTTEKRPPPVDAAAEVTKAKTKSQLAASSPGLLVGAGGSAAAAGSAPVDVIKVETPLSTASCKVTVPSSDRTDGVGGGKPNKRPAMADPEVVVHSSLGKKARLSSKEVPPPLAPPLPPAPQSSSSPCPPTSSKGTKSRVPEVRMAKAAKGEETTSKGEVVKTKKAKAESGKLSRTSSSSLQVVKGPLSTDRKVEGTSSVSKRDKKLEVLKNTVAKKTSHSTPSNSDSQVAKEEPVVDFADRHHRVKAEPEEAVDARPEGASEQPTTKAAPGKQSSAAGPPSKKESSSYTGVGTPSMVASVVKKEPEVAVQGSSTHPSLPTAATSVSKSKDNKHRSRDASKELDIKRRKHDVTPSSQASSTTDTPKTSSEGIERNTNHDRMTPTVEGPADGSSGSTQRTSSLPSDFFNGCMATLEKIDSEINMMRQQVSDYYLVQAKNLKHEADNERDRTIQALKYLHAVMYFILTGSAMESEHLAEKLSFMMYKNTLDLIKFISSKFRYHQSSSQNGSIDGKLAVLSLWCQSILFLKLFNMRKNEVRDCQRTLMDYEKTPVAARQPSSQPLQHQHPTASPCQPSSVGATGGGGAPSIWNSKTTGTPSPMSPLPSPAGSVGSVESQSSGYSSSEIGGGGGGGCPQAKGGPSQSSASTITSSSNSAALTNPAAHASQFATVSVPVHIHSTMQKQLTNLNYLASCHDLWEQAESLITRGRIQGFFENLDHFCGKLTLHSPLKDLVRYVMLGLHCLNVEV